MREIKKLFIMILSLLLASCSETTFVKDNNSNYLNAKSLPPLKIPPGLSSSTFQAHYPVSQENYPAHIEKPNLVPPGLLK